MEAQELHKPTINKFKRRQIITLGIDDMWAADLVLMNKYFKENDGYKYMLNVIDSFSKFVWSKPLKNKNGKEVSEEFENIIKESKKVDHSSPNLLHTDKGTEFTNKDFKKILDKYKIKLYHTENEEKSAIVERFNRTLNSKMKIKFEIQKNFRWIDNLQNLVHEYNYKNVHSKIKMTPAEVNKKNEKDLLDNVYYYIVGNDKPVFKIGDRVRITRKKNIFQNKYQITWQREIFVIKEILDTNPITYKIKDLKDEDIIGSFYKQELQLSNF